MEGKLTVATEVVKIPTGIWRNMTEFTMAETLPSSRPLAKNCAKNWLTATIEAEAR
jgi:hypothetical protein